MEKKDFLILLKMVENQFDESIIDNYKNLYDTQQLAGCDIDTLYFSLTFFEYFNVLEAKNEKEAHLFLQALYQSHKEGHLCLSLPFGSPLVERWLKESLFFHFYAVDTIEKVDIQNPIIIYKNDKEQKYQCYFNKAYDKALKLYNFCMEFKAQSDKDSLTVETIQKLIESYESQLSFKLNGDQKQALERTLMTPFSIIKGGPGTGKTTLILFLLECFLNLCKDPLETIHISILGFTGRSVARVKESLTQNLWENTPFCHLKQVLDDQQVTFQTIDYFLLSHQQEDLTEIKTLKPIHFLIIDEISMVSVKDLSDIFEYINPNTKVTMIGDPYQLPSLESGAVFDLLDSKRFGLKKHLSILKKSMRSQNQALTHLLSKIQDSYEKSQAFVQYPIHQKELGIKYLTPEKAFTSGDLKGLFEYESPQNLDSLIKSDKTGVYFVELQEENFFTQQQWVLEELFKSYYLEIFSNNQSLKEDKNTKNDHLIIENSIRMVDNFRILSPLNKGLLGVKDINQKYLDYYQYYFDKDYTGLPCLITKNLYHLNLNNGDMGVIVDDQFYIKKADEIYQIALNKISHYDISFATSIHKSQGSEYSTVVVVLPLKTPPSLLTRQIVYTALSRAKEKVIVIGCETTLLSSFNTVFKRDNGIFSE